jgi:WD40 repeat protein
LSSGDSIVYSVGRTLIRYDDRDSAQQHFAQVDGGITCLALHKEKSLCAVGQDDHGIVIVVVRTMNYLCRIAADDIRCLAFDESGSYLVVVDGKRLIVYNLDDDGSIVSSTHTHATMTLDIKFTRNNSNELVECGMNYVRFWSIQGGEMIFEDANMTTMESVSLSQITTFVFSHFSSSDCTFILISRLLSTAVLGGHGMMSSSERLQAMLFVLLVRSQLTK